MALISSPAPNRGAHQGTDREATARQSPPMPWWTTGVHPTTASRGVQGSRLNRPRWGTWAAIQHRPCCASPAERVQQSHCEGESHQASARAERHRRRPSTDQGHCSNNSS